MSNTPIKARGEASIVLGTALIKLKVNYKVLMRIEAQLHGLGALFQRFSALDLRLEDLAVMLHEMSSEAGSTYTKDECAEMLFDNGSMMNAKAVIQPLVDAMDTKAKGAKAGEAKGE
jgi:hypothetical protein